MFWIYSLQFVRSAARLPAVTRLGDKAPIGLLLADVGGSKFGFGALLATFWSFESLATIELHMRNQNWTTFRQCLVP